MRASLVKPFGRLAAQALPLAMALALLLLAAAPVSALVKPGPAMPALTLPDTQGQPHDLLALTKDKVALVIYWSISCPHCRVEMPRLLTLAKRFEGNPFALVLVNTDGLAMGKAVTAYAQEQRLPGPLLVDAGPKDTLPFAEAFDIMATPGVLVFDRAGKLTWIQELKVDLEGVAKAIENGFNAN